MMRVRAHGNVQPIQTALTFNFLALKKAIYRVRMETGYYRNHSLGKYIGKEKGKALQGSIVCVDGYRQGDETKKGFPSTLAKLAQKLGAQISFGISPKVSFVVADTMGSKLCTLAAENNILVVLPKYLVEVSQQSKLLPLEPYVLRPFHGLFMCPTGLDLEDMRRIQIQVEELGGRFTVDLVKDQVTHLIARKPAGRKYEAAVAWGIKVVLPDWIEACANAKRWISEFIYRVRTVELSVEGDESIPDSVSLDVSMQLEPDMRVPITSKASLGEGAVGFEEIAADTATSSSSAVVISKGRKRSSPQSLVEQIESFLLTSISVKKLPCASLISSNVLHRQEFYIIGYPPDVQDYMVKCILYAHGHVAPTVSYSTGYLALGPHTPPVVRGVLNQHPLDVQAINLVWLLDQLFGPEAWTHLLDSWTP